MIFAGLVDVIHWLENVFERLQLQRSYGDAIAYNYYGPPRFTQDVLALVSDTKVPELVEEFSSAGCRHLSPGARPVAAFACQGIRTELFLPWHPFHYRVLERSPERDLEGRMIRIHAPEDLIVFKKVFDRPKDIGDIKAMLMAQKGKLDIERLKCDGRQLLTPDSYRELESLIEQFA